VLYFGLYMKTDPYLMVSVRLQRLGHLVFVSRSFLRMIGVVQGFLCKVRRRVNGMGVYSVVGSKRTKENKGEPSS